MSKFAKSLLASQAACHLGVSVKALRLYEQEGLLRPARSESGYRTYSPEDLLVAQDVVVLRRLGLSLVQVGQALAGNALALDAVLAQRELELSAQFAEMHRASARLRELRAELAMGHAPKAGHLADALRSHAAGISFRLPWPWGGEQFTLMELLPLTYLVGPLGSGKTRLALLIAEVLPNAQYVDSLRLTQPGQFERGLQLTAEEVEQVQCGIDWLQQEGATDIPALRLIVGALEAHGGQRPLVIDMIEEGLARSSQEALMGLLRGRLKMRSAPVIAMTRSSSILDPSRVGPNEAILFCPANHSVPFVVPPFPGAAGFEALCSCLATPEVRARLAHAPA